jgi:hypothetical protein
MLLLEPSMAEVARANRGNPGRQEAEALLGGANNQAHRGPRA